MTGLIAIDPGVHGSGVAWFNHGKLITAEYRTVPLPSDCPSWRTVCEKPRVYDKPVKISGRLVRIDPDDLIELAIAAGRITGQRKTEYIFPSAWKGQVPKPIMHARIDARLTGPERELLVTCLERVKERLRHNVLDAVGIGMEALGRLDGRVPK